MAAPSTSTASTSASHAQGAAASSAAGPSRLVRASSPASSLLSPGLATVSARSRHSLYGAEDRVVLDIGSRVWKIGFSGESAPRAVFDVGEVWSYSSIETANANSKQQERQCQRLIKKYLRRVYYDELMTDPKARKVIVLENPMMPLRIKQYVAKVLFDHLQAPSLSFALSPLCALLSIGRATGLVVDVGNLESTLLPIYASRPLFSYLRTSPVASRQLSLHLQHLLRRFGTFMPHASMSASTRTAVTVPSAPQPSAINPVAEEILPMAIVEEIKTRACFVDPDMPDEAPPGSSQQRPNINSDMYSTTSTTDAEKAAYLDFKHTRLRRKYGDGDSSSPSEASNLALRLPTGTLNVPGWVRYACTDIFFDSVGDVDDPSIPELILDSILKLPIDLRKIFISNLLITGGGSMLPGFPLRLAESIRTLLHRDKRYTSLRGLSRNVCIVNCSREGDNGTDTSAAEAEAESAGGAASFAWERSLLAWVGASLVGAMKASGREEWTRETWEVASSSSEQLIASGDWTRRGWK